MLINKLFKKLIKELLSIRFGKFLSVGGLGFVIDSISFYVFQWFEFNHLIARAMSYWLATTNNWFFNRIFTFKDAKYERKNTQWLKYCCMALVSFFINWGTYYLLTTNLKFFEQYNYLAFILGVGSATLFNFLTAKRIIFKVN